MLLLYWGNALYRQTGNEVDLTVTSGKGPMVFFSSLVSNGLDFKHSMSVCLYYRVVAACS